MFIDFIIVLMLVVFPFVGFKKGFLLSCVGMCSTLFCFVMSFKTTPLFIDFIKAKTNIFEFLSNITVGADENVAIIMQKSKVFNAICNLVSITDIEISVGDLVLALMSFVFIFVFCKICISVLVRFVSRIVKKLPIVGKINSIFGSVLGVLKSFVLIFTICAIALTVSKIPEFGSVVSAQIEQSLLFDIFSESSAELVDVFLNSVKM